MREDRFWDLKRGPAFIDIDYLFQCLFNTTKKSESSNLPELARKICPSISITCLLRSTNIMLG